MVTLASVGGYDWKEVASVDQSKDLRSQRKQVADQLAELRGRKTTLLREREEVKGSLAGADWSDIAALRQTEAYQKAEGIQRELGEVENKIEQLTGTNATLLGLLDNASGNGSHAPSPDGGPAYYGWDGRRMLEASDEYKRFKEAGVFSSSARFGTLTLGQVAPREIAMEFVNGRIQAQGPIPAAPGGDIATFAGGVRPDFRGIVPPLLQPLTLLDLIPTGTTDSNVVNYVQVTGLPLGAAPVAELALKPPMGLATVDETAPVRTIAGYIKASRQSLDDIAGLGTFINTQIPYAVRYALLNQVVGGDGTGQNMLGLYHVSGINTPAFVAGDNIADAVLRVATAIVLSGAEPNFVAMHPNDYEALATMKNAQGSYLYLQPGQPSPSAPALSPPMTLWGMAVTRNWAIPQGQPIVGDAMGCTLLIKEGLNVRTSDSDQDDFVRNRVTILGEMRAAFVVWRPAAFGIAATHA